jgi:twitching motility two-component system response regulator PilH
MTGLKVLVADDSWTDLSLIATPLVENGFNVVTAMDGDEAIEKALLERPNCIVLDVVMPKQNGFQVCRRLRGMEECRAIPIILLSGKNTPQDRHWGMQQGADLYLTKPFTREELVASVLSLM